MFHNHISVLCLQETHRTVSEYHITDGGFPVCFAGVGVTVAPQCRRCDGSSTRLHKMHACESHLIGPHTFGNKEAHLNAESDRSLLLEMCKAPGLFVAWFRFAREKTSHRAQRRLKCNLGPCAVSIQHNHF